MRLMKDLALGLAAIVAACATTQSPAPVTGSHPRLAVVIVVDGLPQRQAVDYRDQLAPDGFERFFTRGAWFTEAHYGQAVTETAPGHATLATGAYPRRHGIIANEWLDRTTQRPVHVFADPDRFYLHHRVTFREGTSPNQLLVETLGDAMRRADPRSKVVTISAKDRSAIATAGKQGAPYVFDDEHGTFDSTTAFMKALPAWADEFNASDPTKRYLGAEWKPLLPDAAYARSLPDERPWYADAGKLPKKLPEQLGGRFFRALMASPFGDDVLLAFARAAVNGEQLGRDGSPDLLVVSLSAHDYVNHAYGAESRISHDHVLYLDRELQDFFNDLDVAVGRDNYVAVVTADHGFTPVPEHSQSLGRDAGRADPAKMIEHVSAGLVSKFGRGRYLVGWSADGLLLNRQTITNRKANPAEVAAEARRLLAAEPRVLAAFTKAEIEAAPAPGDSPLLEAVRKSWYPERSPDVHVVLKPYWLLSTGSKSTSHGSPHPYDTNVPLMWYGPPWIVPARLDQRVEIADVAPTLARLLGVPVPAASEGKPLPLQTPGR